MGLGAQRSQSGSTKRLVGVPAMGLRHDERARHRCPVSYAAGFQVPIQPGDVAGFRGEARPFLAT